MQETPFHRYKQKRRNITRCTFLRKSQLRTTTFLGVKVWFMHSRKIPKQWIIWRKILQAGQAGSSCHFYTTHLRNTKEPLKLKLLPSPNNLLFPFITSWLVPLLHQGGLMDLTCVVISQVTAAEPCLLLIIQPLLLNAACWFHRTTSSLKLETKGTESLSTSKNITFYRPFSLTPLPPKFWYFAQHQHSDGKSTTGNDDRCIDWLWNS